MLDWKVLLGHKQEDATLTYITKRAGEVEPYNKQKIVVAINKAIKASRKEANLKLAEELALKVDAKVKELLAGRHSGSVPHLEEIQDLVEDVLIEEKHKDLAKSYILYRSRRSDIREAKLTLDVSTLVDSYLDRSDWRVNENANVNFSLGGLILHNAGTVTANYWLKNVYRHEIAEAHRSCAMHLHDLSMFSPYCAGWSLRQLIEEGLGGVADKITSKPAAHLSTLVNQMVNFLGIMQNEWAGAQAFSSFDTYLAPFIRADNLNYNEVKQCVQSFIFGVNTPSRWGTQAPFTNITLDWTCPDDLKERKAIVAGREQPFTYGDCAAEMALVNKAFLEIMLAGDANGRGFAYPIPTYNITKDFIWESENAKLLFEMAGKYGTPYFQNFINSDLNPEDVRSMCCRLRLDKRELRKRGGGLFGSDEFTGSIGVVTINLPQLAFLAVNKEDFFARLTHVMNLAAESLQAKRKVVARLMEAGLFPYTKHYLKHLDNHFNTIGICGMNEALLNFNFINADITQPAARALALEILDFMRAKMQDYQEEYGSLFNLEASPAESTSYRLAKHDKENYPAIIVSGNKESPYYTNSTQLPVMQTNDIFEALDHQDELQTKYTGGTVFHCYLGEEIKDWQITRKLVQNIAQSYRLPYFTLSPVFSVCARHGYLVGQHFNCPKCEEQNRLVSAEITAIKEELAKRSA
ncbi:MAG: ribonucleoside triphosphate reductase [Spirochaetaceae bacterium]|nr:ribonucleoside triphosphate reductase [Spirochaetaceae bacterium]